MESTHDLPRRPHAREHHEGREIEAEHLRLAVLQLLQVDYGYAHNELILQRALEQVGHGVSGDRLRGELAWLAEQGLIVVEDVCGLLHLARITARGADVALGRARVPGVARPRPTG